MDRGTERDTGVPASKRILVFVSFTGSSVSDERLRERAHLDDWPGLDYLAVNCDHFVPCQRRGTVIATTG